MKRNLLSDLTNVVLVVCALVVTGAVVKREFLTPTASASPATYVPRRIPGGQDLTSGVRLLGRPDAPVKIVVFSDFQCPFCSTFHQTLQRVRARHPERVAVAYRHLPLDAIHPHARVAGLAAECAGEQGRFESYADLLFAQQDAIGRKEWSRFAAEARVPDVNSFDACMVEQRWADEIERDSRITRELNITVTPTFIINGTMIPGVTPEADLEKWILDPASIPGVR
jgi:protein-disulfide isomerase